MSDNIILASTSPRRKAILSLLGVKFDVTSVDVDESIAPNESPYDYVHRLAVAKAHSTVSNFPKSIIIGGDVTIDRDGVALAKAENATEARDMLKSLSGKTHIVRDAFAIFTEKNKYSSGVVSSFVTFRQLSEEEIDDYISGGEWEGKAGAYAIQGDAAKFVSKIEGSYYDILGLPVYAVGAALISLGFSEVASRLDSIHQEDLSIIRKIISN